MNAPYLTEDNRTEKAITWIETVGRGRGGWTRPESPALLVLDMQDFFLAPESHAFVPSARALIEPVRDMVALFRKAGWPIIMTRHVVKPGGEGVMGRWWRDTLYEEHPFSALTPAISNEPVTAVITKDRYSAFVGTDLDALLRKKRVHDVVICGVVTHLCCETTARDAFMRDYGVWTLVDATADWDETMHVNSLRALADGFSMLAGTEEVREWG